MLRENWSKFDGFTHGNEQKIIEQMLETMKNNNRKVKEMASDVLESFIECLSKRETIVSRDLLQYFINKVKAIIKAQQDPVEVMVCIRCFGHLSSLIKRSFGPEDLKTHFLLLYEISQNRVLDDITDSYKNIDADAIQPENFKKILYRQKQLNSHIKAFALIVKEMDSLAENHAKHLVDLLMIGVRKHKLFFEGYKKYLYIAIVQLICSMSFHGNLYKFWIKKVISEIISAFVEMTESELAQYDQDANSVKSSAEFIVRLLKHEAWIPEVKFDFMKSLLSGIADFFSGSEFGYEEILKQGKKIYLPQNIEDQHLTLRLALIFEEVQRHGVFDEVLPEHFEELLGITHKGLSKFIRTSSLQKLFRSLLCIAERLQVPLLKETPENMEIIESIIDLEFGMLRELRGDILLDCLRSLLFTPTPLLRKSNKLLEVFKRGLLLTLETSGPQSIFMLDHAVANLERVLVKEKVDLRTTKDRFLQETLPYFAALLDMQLEDTKDAIYTTTLQESLLEREVVLRKCISFLGSLGSDLHYMAKGRTKEQELEQAEGDVLKVSIQISKQKISLNLNDIIKRASTLALESPNKEIQSAACELFHASIVVIIGKCSQGNQSNEDFVDALESSLPSIVKLAINSTAFSPLFKELLLQIARWLSFNKEEENLLAATFIASLLELSGCGDKPEVRSLCMEAIGQFVEYTCKWHANCDVQLANFGIFFRKIEGLTLHPDDYKRLAGLMALRLALSQISKIDGLVRYLFFDVVYYFIMFLRKQAQLSDEDRSSDSNLVCEEMYTQIEQLLKSQSKRLESLENENARFVSMNDMFCNLQKNLYSPESALREYSLRLWLLIRNNYPQLLRADTLAASLGFLEHPTPPLSEDFTLAVRCTGALFDTLAELVSRRVIQERHLRESSAWRSVLSGVELLSSRMVEQVPELVKRKAIMGLVNLAGHVHDSVRESLLGSIKNSELVNGLISSAFASRSSKSVETCKKVLNVLQVNIVQTVKDFVNRHNFRFDNYRDPVLNPNTKIPTKELDCFFNTILQFMDPKTVVAELVNEVRVKIMLNFIKNLKKSEKVDAIARAKVFIQFLLNCNALKESQIAEFLDPFNPAYDNYSVLVKSHISKAPEEFSRQLISYLFLQTRKDHNQFNSVLDLLQLFINSEKKTDAFFDSFNDCFDLHFIKTHDHYLKSVINLSILFIREGRQLADDLCVGLLERSLGRENRGLLGLMALDFLGEYSRKASHDRTLLVFRRVKPLMIDYSRDMLPVILDATVEQSKYMESIRDFASKVFSLIENSGMIEPIELIFPLIRNKKAFRVELSGIIKACVPENNYAVLLANVQYCMAIFNDTSLSESLEYNIRFRIVERVLLPMLEASKSEFLVDLFIELYPELESKTLEPSMIATQTAKNRLIQASEKACAFKLVELMFRKIGSEAIKDKIHPKLIGPTTQKNEITKRLITFCTNPKKFSSLFDFEESCIREINLEKSEWVQFIKPILLDYYTSAYACLISVFLNTQTKEGIFCKYLLTSEGKDLVLSNIVDNRSTYNFTVSTHFNSENLEDFYKLDSSSEHSYRNDVRNFVAKLTADSLFTQTMSRGRLLPPTLDDSAGQRDKILQAIGIDDENGLIMNEPMDIEVPSGSKLEMDPVNNHPVMKPLIRLIDFLQANFGKTETTEVPSWINIIIRLFEDHHELNQRLILLKLIMNRSAIFKPFRSILNQYLLEYIGMSEANGGPGFHYFLRDACTTLISWNQEDDEVTVSGGPMIQKKLCCNAVRNLCKKLADQTKPIFLINIEIFQRLCHLLRKVLIIDENLVFNLLLYGHKKEGQDPDAKLNLTNTEILWRLTGISILETSIYEGVEVGQFDLTNQPAGGSGSGGSADNTISHLVALTQSQPSLSQSLSARQTLSSAISMDIDAEGKLLAFNNKVLDAVVLNMRAKKKVLCSAAFRLAGLYLNYLAGRLPYSHPVYESVKTKILNEIQSLCNKGHLNMEVNICELCKVYPEIAVENKILIQLTTFILKTSGKTRGYVFDSLRAVYSRCLEKPDVMEWAANDIILTLRSCLDKIMRDSDPINIRSFLVLLTEAAKLTTLKKITSFLEDSFEKISSMMLKLLRNEDSIYFFDFVVLIHENYKDIPPLMRAAKRYIVLGLSHSNEEVRRMFFGFLEKDAKGISTEDNLLTFILRDLYNPEYEHQWLTTSAQMIINLAVSTGQTNQLIFDRPLAGYVSSGLFTFPSRMNYVSQMTQPLVPLTLVAPSQAEFRTIERVNHSATLMDQEQIMKVKSKYVGSESDDKAASIINEDLPISLLYSDSDAITAKLSVHALNKTLKPQGIKSGLHKTELRDFLRRNQVSFNQVSQTGDNKLRVIETVGVIKNSRLDLKSLGGSREGSNIQKSLRAYQKGDLPDIQLKYSDIVKPLGVLAAQDAKMAQLIFVPLFIEVYKNQSGTSALTTLQQLLRIIDESQADYQVINTVQTVLYEMSLQASTLEIDPMTIAKTGTKSLSFGGAALLLEDMLARLQRDLVRDVSIEKTMTKVRGASPSNNYRDDEKFLVKVDDPQSLRLILNLVDVYKQMNDDDVLRGLYRLIHADDAAANDVFDLKMGKKVVLSLKKLEEMVEIMNDHHSEKDKLLHEYLAQEKRENLYILNKWDDLVQDIKNDPNYLDSFRQGTETAFILTDLTALKKTDRYYLYRGMLNDDNYWDNCRESTEVLMSDYSQKNILEKDHSYEMSLLAVTMLEFDRAKFYLEKFKDKFLQHWSGVKDFSGLQTKTEVISELLRQHELKEFLICTRHYNIEGMVSSPDLERFRTTLEGWLGHNSSSTLENFNYLSDSYHARCLFIDIMKNRHEQYDEQDYNQHHLKASLDYASGLLKMGHVDTAERILSKAYSRKDRFLQCNNSLDFDVASLIVQSRLEGIDRDINFISRQMDESNINLKFLNTRFQKLDQLRDNLTPKNGLDTLKDLRFSLLKLKTKTREIAAIKDYLGPASNETEDQYIPLIWDSLSLAGEKIKSVDQIENFEKLMEGEKSSSELPDIKAKLYQTTCEITESYLRWFKAKASDQNLSLNKLASLEPQNRIFEVAKELVTNVAHLTHLGIVDHSKLLFTLEIVVEFGETLGIHFTSQFNDAPCWIFIKWIPQIMSYLNFDVNGFFLPLIEKIMEKYPEPAIYAISVAIDSQLPSERESQNIKKLRTLLQRKIGEESSHKKFIRSLECLLHPDQRLKEWLDLLEDNAKDSKKVKLIVDYLVKDMFSQNDPILENGFGEFNKKFAKEMERYVTTTFGSGFSNISKMSATAIEKACSELFIKADGYCKGKSMSYNTSSYKTKLSAFSGWLSEYDINNYRAIDQRLEVPGQYSGEIEPVPELHVKIAYFLPEVLVIQSIRRPKRLTMLGTDEKVYHCLVKGGEDLRLDQRIEQLFSIMNNVFSRDAECAKREFKIGTFNVIPVKKHLGIMEWVKNTVPLKSVIEKEMAKHEDILNNNGAIKRTNLLKQLARGKDIREQHLALLSAKRELIVKEFNTQCQFFKHTLLKTAIKKKVHNAEQFVKLRKQFLSNYAVLSLGSYILGVGDRHLDNFLFDYVNGQIVPIDFGYSFGFGVGLYIPELMPFRLTQNFMELLYPLGVQGVFRNSMIFAMKALKAERHIVTDTCEVFIRDPLIDWVKIAKNKATNQSSQTIEEAAVYPKEKLAVVHKKLTGINPVTIMLEELKLSRHYGQNYFPSLEEIVRGDHHRVRANLGLGILPLCEQVDALIDMATDPDILGRTWSGWAPYA